MLDCLILGDSIAVGVQQYKPNCALYAQVGINSKHWNKNFTMMNLDADTVIISLGTNDYQGIDTKRELMKLRERVKAKKVYWIVPAIKPQIQSIVKEIAAKHGDWFVRIPNLSKDGIHPTQKGYQQLGSIMR